MLAAFYLRPLGQFLICSPSGEVGYLREAEDGGRGGEGDAALSSL